MILWRKELIIIFNVCYYFSYPEFIHRTLYVFYMEIYSFYYIIYMFFSFGFVTFSSIEDASKAKEKYNGQYLDGNNVIIRFETKSSSDKPRLIRDIKSGSTQNKRFVNANQRPTMKLIVRNLPYSVTEEQLSALYGNAVRTLIAIDKDGNSRG